MKLSEVTTKELMSYAEEYSTDEATKSKFTILQAAAISYILSYTGLTKEQADTHEDLSIALMVIVNDMYENRIMTVEKNSVNKLVSSILDMHAINFL